MPPGAGGVSPQQPNGSRRQCAHIFVGSSIFPQSATPIKKKEIETPMNLNQGRQSSFGSSNPCPSLLCPSSPAITPPLISELCPACPPPGRDDSRRDEMRSGIVAYARSVRPLSGRRKELVAEGIRRGHFQSARHSTTESLTAGSASASAAAAVAAAATTAAAAQVARVPSVAGLSLATPIGRGSPTSLGHCPLPASAHCPMSASVTRR